MMKSIKSEIFRIIVWRFKLQFCLSLSIFLRKIYAWLVSIVGIVNYNSLGKYKTQFQRVINDGIYRT